MSVSNYLLNDEQMRQFISRGYLVLQTDFPKEFHERLKAKLNEAMEKEGNPGNNILPRFSEVGDIIQNPVVRGALTSVVGPDYTIHPHRHCHFTYPGRKVQTWHKDSYWGHQKVRNHHNWWAMIFYYPQAVDEEMVHEQFAARADVDDVAGQGRGQRQEGGQSQDRGISDKSHDDVPPGGVSGRRGRRGRAFWPDRCVVMDFYNASATRSPTSVVE